MYIDIRVTTGPRGTYNVIILWSRFRSNCACYIFKLRLIV